MFDRIVGIVGITIVLGLVSLLAYIGVEAGRTNTRREQCESTCLPNAVIQSTRLYCSCVIETKTIWRKDIK